MGNRNDLPVVILNCDGSCAPTGTRAHHGGWTSILVFGDLEKVVSGHSFPETNSTMEIKALLGGLKELKRPCRVEIFCDAKYVVNGVNEWIDSWVKRGWKGRNGPVAHRELWEQVNSYRKIHDMHAHWIRGHSPKKDRSEHQEYNVRCDELAEIEAWKSYKEITGKEREKA